MKINYVKLENVAGLYVGSNIDTLEIDFTKSRNKIVSIQSENGRGKSVLLSSLTPFAHVNSIDDRSSLSYIIQNKNGYKEIHYQKDENLYVIKHYFKSTKDGSHTIKSYISLNGEELNQSGNVTSFISLIEFHFQLTPEMMRLMRLGSNVHSFITLTPAKRKEYIGNLISEIDLYLKIYKKINEDIRVLKVLLSSNNTNLYNYHIQDPVLEEDKIRKLKKQIKEYEKERDSLVARISNIQSLERDNNIDDLRRKKQEAESQLRDIQKTEEDISSMSLGGISVDQLIKERSKLTETRIDVQSKVNSYRISIDNAMKNIERLEVSVKRVTSNNDIQSLMSAIENLRILTKDVNGIITGFIPPKCTSSDIYSLITKLSSFNQISQMIYTFGNRPSDIYLKLKRENKSVDKFLKDQMKKSMSKINDGDLHRLLSKVFQDDQMITPNCDTQFSECPYYRLTEIVVELKDKLEEESYDDETLRYIQVISNNLDNIFNELDRLSLIQITDKLKEIMREKAILDRMASKFSFFDLSELQEYLSLVREYEVYMDNMNKLKQYEHQLSIYQNSGIDNQLIEIRELRENIDFYNRNISILENELRSIADQITELDRKIVLVTKYNDGMKYQSIIKSTLESTNRILIPLESSNSEKIDLTYQLNSINSTINSLREEMKEVENKLTEYNRLLNESRILKRKFQDLNMILESVSTKKGIPVLYMKSYLGKIQKLSNSLLQLIYEDELHLSSFKVTQETFEVPYIKNGIKVPDVRYASQSELSLITMALSFALANKASEGYNILLLDEIDAGLDENNRYSFLKMLDRQMHELKSEQTFLISHNIGQMTNLPIDVIRLSSTYEVHSKLHNVIYG